MPQTSHLLCPVCRQKLILNSKNAVCPQNHNFDRARQGYLNLHLSPVKTHYTKTLYLARQHLFNNGVFGPLVAHLSDLVLRCISVASPLVLDAACGDGSLLSALIRTLSQHNCTPAGLGIDICKDAIRVASRAYPDLIWCVADLAKPPVAENSQDVIINILAPANYYEFSRLLTPKGVLIKVLPGPEHFKEIRQVLQSPVNIPSISAAPGFYPVEMPSTMDHAKPYFTFLEAYRLTYDVSAVDNIEYFVQMSPLAWHTIPEKKESALSGSLLKVRLDYFLVLARSKP